MAPEMLEKSGHNFSIDFYCLGIFLYELVCGFPPFFSFNQTRKEIYSKILTKNIVFPSYFSEELKSLITGLTLKDRNKRLGNKSGFYEIIKHEWCKNINWKEVANKKLTPPFSPSFQYNNFNKENNSVNNANNLKLFYKDDRVNLKNVLTPEAIKDIKKYSLASTITNRSEGDEQTKNPYSFKCMFDKFANFSFYSYDYEGGNEEAGEDFSLGNDLTFVFEDESSISNIEKNSGSYKKIQLKINRDENKSRLLLGDITLLSDESEENEKV